MAEIAEVTLVIAVMLFWITVGFLFFKRNLVIFPLLACAFFFIATMLLHNPEIPANSNFLFGAVVLIGLVITLGGGFLVLRAMLYGPVEEEVYEYGESHYDIQSGNILGAEMEWYEADHSYEGQPYYETEHEEEYQTPEYNDYDYDDYDYGRAPHAPRAPHRSEKHTVDLGKLSPAKAIRRIWENKEKDVVHVNISRIAPMTNDQLWAIASMVGDPEANVKKNQVVMKRLHVSREEAEAHFAEHGIQVKLQ